MNETFQVFTGQIDKEAELARRKKELSEKKLILDERRTGYEHDKLAEMDRSEELIKKANFGIMSSEQIDEMIKESNDYMIAARNGMQFMTTSFDGIVPFFQKNLIVIGGSTGDGKSTTVANIAFNIIRQRNPKTDKHRSILIITNEEKKEDVFNRISCAGKGWAYTNHDKFTDQQIVFMNQSLRYMASNGLVHVVDDYAHGSTGTTTTIEGIKRIFDKLIDNKIYYDAIVIDYYQNIKGSSLNPHMSEFECQSIVSNMLDKYKNVYPAPIVVLAQVKPPGEDREEPFQFRIKGRKIICDPATFIMEIISDRKRLRTEWVVHKSRFTESVGKSIWTGFDKGRFVTYDDAFAAKVNKYLEEKEAQKIKIVTGVEDKK